MQLLFSGSSLSCSSRKGTLSIWLVKLQYIVFALWTPYNTQLAEPSLAQGGQRGWLKWHNISALVKHNYKEILIFVKCSKAHTISVLSKKNKTLTFLSIKLD